MSSGSWSEESTQAWCVRVGKCHERGLEWASPGGRSSYISGPGGRPKTVVHDQLQEGARLHWQVLHGLGRGSRQAIVRRWMHDITITIMRRRCGMVRACTPMHGDLGQRMLTGREEFLWGRSWTGQFWIC